MARPLRIEYEGAVYHVTARGNDRKKIFFSKIAAGRTLCLTKVLLMGDPFRSFTTCYERKIGIDNSITK